MGLLRSPTRGKPARHKKPGSHNKLISHIKPGSHNKLISYIKPGNHNKLNSHIKPISHNKLISHIKPCRSQETLFGSSSPAGHKRLWLPQASSGQRLAQLP